MVELTVVTGVASLTTLQLPAVSKQRVVTAAIRLNTLRLFEEKNGRVHPNLHMGEVDSHLALAVSSL